MSSSGQKKEKSTNIEPYLQYVRFLFLRNEGKNIEAFQVAF